MQRFPRNPLQLLIFLGSLSSYIICEPGPTQWPTMLLVYIKTVTPMITFLGLGAAAEVDIYVNIAEWVVVWKTFQDSWKGSAGLFFLNLCTLTASSSTSSGGEKVLILKYLLTATVVLLCLQLTCFTLCSTLSITHMLYSVSMD